MDSDQGSTDNTILKLLNRKLSVNFESADVISNQLHFLKCKVMSSLNKAFISSSNCSFVGT